MGCPEFWLVLRDIEWGPPSLCHLGMLTHLSVLQQVSIEHLLCARPPAEHGEEGSRDRKCISMACVLIQPASLLIGVENHTCLLDKQKQGSEKVKKITLSYTALMISALF